MGPARGEKNERFAVLTSVATRGQNAAIRAVYAPGRPDWQVLVCATATRAVGGEMAPWGCAMSRHHPLGGTILAFACPVFVALGGGPGGACAGGTRYRALTHWGNGTQAGDHALQRLGFPVGGFLPSNLISTARARIGDDTRPHVRGGLRSPQVSACPTSASWWR